MSEKSNAEEIGQEMLNYLETPKYYILEEMVGFRVISFIFVRYLIILFSVQVLKVHRCVWVALF